MSNSIYLPYTYLIGWSNLNWWYYGVRYAKKCHPNDLWSTYFTSSKEVAKIRTVYGEPNVIQIRKTFNDPNKAREWEIKVLHKLKVVENTKWLNKTDHLIYEIRYGKNHHFYGVKRFGFKNNSWKGGKITIICHCCNNPFDVFPGYKNRKFCSNICRKTHSQKNKIKKECLICQTIFYVSPSSNQKYCSLKCHGISEKGDQNPSYKGKLELVCNHCKEPFTVPLWRKNSKFCSRRCQLKSLPNRK